MPTHHSILSLQVWQDNHASGVVCMMADRFGPVQKIRDGMDRRFPFDSLGNPAENEVNASLGSQSLHIARS